MKKIVTTIAFLALGLASQSQAAQIAAPAWACKLSAQVKDHSFSLIVGLVNVAGPAKIRCTSALGQRMERNAVVQIVGVSYGPDISLPTGETADLEMLSAAVGLSSVDAMFGEYTVSVGVTGHLGTLQGDVKHNLLSVTPRLPNGSISRGFSISVKQGGQFGLGINKNITGMVVMTPSEYKKRQRAQEQALFDRQGSNAN